MRIFTSSRSLWVGLLALSVADISVSTNATDAKCSNAAVYVLEKYFETSSIQGIAQFLLGKVKDECTSGKCPRIDVSASCKNQSVDDINCEIKDIFSERQKLGTDDICDAGCSDWPCKAGCQGIDTGICYASDWLLCKAGCVGISACIHKCEEAIVDPCKQKLIKECSDKCEDAFHKCKDACEKKLTLDISGDFESFQHIVTSMNVSSLNANCSGNGLFSPLKFQAHAVFSMSGAALSIKVHTLDAGVSSTTTVNMQNIRLSVVSPLSGSLQCGLGHDHISVDVAQLSIIDVDLDVDLQLDKTLDTIAKTVCVGLPFCEDAIKKSISKTIKTQIIQKVPSQVAARLQPVFQKLADELHCPKLQLLDHINEFIPTIV